VRHKRSQSSDDAKENDAVCPMKLEENHPLRVAAARHDWFWSLLNNWRDWSERFRKGKRTWLGSFDVSTV